MHAVKIRTANVPAFQLSPRESAIMATCLALVAYIVGFFVGLAF